MAAVAVPATLAAWVPMTETRLELLAFYLPQFHPIPQNDEWWGRGFTEWTNVTKAKPLFRGHYQPHIPADLGFYDLRVPEAREAQAELARAHGITGFCYYHYWFGGERLLQRPFDEVLASGRPDFPFLLCWANENWTRAWDGGPNQILLEQQHSSDDDLAHIRHLAPAFADPRYVRVDGKPVFLVYRATELPDVRRTTDVWRQEADRLGIGELYLCRVESFGSERQHRPEELGFDAAVEWIPDYGTLGRPLRRSFALRALRRLGLTAQGYRSNNVFDYQHVIDVMRAREKPDYVRHPCVTPMWDNSPRRATQAVIYRNATPEQYRDWLTDVLRDVVADPAGPHLCFINAWNEWAEGNHLEPDLRWGRRYLDATQEAVLEVMGGDLPARRPEHG